MPDVHNPLKPGIAVRKMTRTPWLVYGLILLFAPVVFKSSSALNLLSQSGYLIIICLSYNMLLGQGGMLSFGHAVYSGLGSFLAIHAMNMAASQALYIPLPLIPLVGGLAGLFLAGLLGYVSTKKAGTTFAMITLGVGELVFAVSLMFPGFFGGEGGITTNRAYGRPVFGLSFGPQIQVYYLIALYCFACTALMFAFTRTPLGRMLNAVRDNPERVEFIGYNPQRVRHLSFTIAGFFAGIGGGLAAINSEIVTSDVMSSLRSGSLLLFTVLGGASFFAGPIIGAALMVLTLVFLSGLSMAWLLYVGLAFLGIVMYAPGGIASIASLVMMNLRTASFGRFRQLLPGYLGLAASAVIALLSAASMVEMLYRLQLNAILGPELGFLGLRLNVQSPQSWMGAGLVLALGLVLFEFTRRRFMRQWNAASDQIEAERRQGELS